MDPVTDDLEPMEETEDEDRISDSVPTTDMSRSASEKEPVGNSGKGRVNAVDFTVILSGLSFTDNTFVGSNVLSFI